MKGLGVRLVLVFLLGCASGVAQQRISPGSQPFTPTRIDWLTTTLQASLRQDVTVENGFQLEITSPDPETILIYVRYLADVDRQAMNIVIDADRKVIKITARSYGWDKWLKIREDIQLADESKGQ